MTNGVDAGPMGSELILKGLTLNNISSNLGNQMRADSKAGYRFYLVIVGMTADPHVYRTIKTLGEHQHGILTVCVIASKFNDNRKNQLQYFVNVALKFNLKLGGANQVLTAKSFDIFEQKPTMLVGLDVTVSLSYCPADSFLRKH